MALREYKYSHRINISHSFNMDDIEKGKHSHTIDMCMFLVEKDIRSDDGKKKFQSYAEVEKIIDDYYKKYNGAFVNEIHPFDKEMPTIEKLGETFFDELKNVFEGTEYAISRMEISEIPSRVYIISDFLKTGEVTTESSKNEINMESYINHTKKYLDFYINNVNRINVSDEEIQEKEDISEVAVTREPENKKNEDKLRLKKWQYPVLALLCAVLTGFVVWIGLILTGNYPAGEDVYFHLTKSDFLYKQIASGNIFPNILNTWFNGYELFGAAAPLATYILALFQFIVGGDIVNSYLLYLSLCAGAGLFGWYLNGALNKKYVVGMILGAIWVFMPVNFNMIMLEGNLPIALVLALVPYVIYASRRIIFEAKISMFILQSLVMAAMLLTDFNSAILILVSLIIVLICFGLSHKKAITTVMACLSLLLSCGIVSGWLINVIGSDFSETFVPKVAHANVGFVILIIALLCIFISSGHTKYAFILSVIYGVIVLFAGIDSTTSVPMGKYIFNDNYAIIVYALFIMGMTEWKKAKKSVVAIIITLIAVCCMPNIISSVDWQFDDETLYEKEMQMIKEEGIGTAVDKTDRSLFLADSNMKSSFAAYYASINDKNISFNYKLDELAPAGKAAIEQMSYSVSAAQYTYLFDRIYEGGNDTVAISKEDIVSDTKKERLENDLTNALDSFRRNKEDFYYEWLYDENNSIHYEESEFAEKMTGLDADKKSFEELLKNQITSISESKWEEEKSYAESYMMEAAERFGYSLVADADKYYVFKNSEINGMKAEAEYEGIAIGKSAGMISRLFPYFKEGEISLDDYSVEELKQYKKIALIGTQWDFNETAEEKIKKLADSGVNIYIDMADISRDAYSGKARLFDVTGHEVHFENGYEYLLYKGKIYETSKFGDEEWDTIYLEGLENVEGYSWLGGEKLPFYGKVYNGNVHMFGFGLIYYTVEMQDRNSSAILADIMGLEINQTPDRKLTDIDSYDSSQTEKDSNLIGIIICYVIVTGLYTMLIIWRNRYIKKDCI